MRYKNIIFDLDGVLVFTDEYHYLAWKQVADKLGIPFDEKMNNRLRGVSRMESLDIILSKSRILFSESQKKNIAEEKNAIYKKFLDNLSPLSIDIETFETLKRLRDSGIKLAIGSSSKNAEYILEKTGISPFFTAVSSGLNILRSKPDPEVFLKAAEYLKTYSKDCLVIEDAHSGIEAACNGGFDSVGMRDAYSNKKATYRIKSIKELIDIVIGSNNVCR